MKGSLKGLLKSKGHASLGALLFQDGDPESCPEAVQKILGEERTREGCIRDNTRRDPKRAKAKRPGKSHHSMKYWLVADGIPPPVCNPYSRG